MTDLIDALSETVVLLNHSQDAIYTRTSVAAIIEALKANISALLNDGSFQADTLSMLFAPTGAIQETAMDNGWSEAYMRLASVIDRYTQQA